MDIRYVGLVAVVVLGTVGTLAIARFPDSSLTIVSFLGSIISPIITLVVLAKVQETREKVGVMEQKVVAVEEQSRITHDAVNSKMDRLLQVTGQAAFAEGQKDQKENPK